MDEPRFRYWVSYFCKLNISTSGLNIDLRGRVGTGVYEMTHPLNTQEHVNDFVKFLTRKENKDTKSGNMWKIYLLGFSLMYIINDLQEV